MDPSTLPLRDLHLPDPVGWWPPAPGWWVLLALAAIAAVWLTLRWLEARRRQAPRRFALRRFKALCREYAKDGDGVRLSRELSALLRRTMLAYAPRADVAGLTGERWLEFLDRGLDRPHFRDGDGRALLDWPYRRPDTRIDRSDVAALVDAVRLRLETPLEGAP